jgi:hypothetical protein
VRRPPPDSYARKRRNTAKKAKKQNLFLTYQKYSAASEALFVAKADEY